MPDDLVGLDISGTPMCGEPHPISGRPCAKPAGHIEAGDGEHNVEPQGVEPPAPSCPDCGSEMEHVFTVVTDDDELALRVWLSYRLLKDADLDVLKKLAEQDYLLELPDLDDIPAEEGDGA